LVVLGSYLIYNYKNPNELITITGFKEHHLSGAIVENMIKDATTL
jgi:hypothetical protein